EQWAGRGLRVGGGGQLLELMEELEADIANDLALQARPITPSPERSNRSDGSAYSEQEEHYCQTTAVCGPQRVVDQIPERERNDPVEPGFNGAGNHDERGCSLVGTEIVSQSSKKSRRAQYRTLLRVRGTQC